MKFIMIRHPETKGNKEKKYIGITESYYTSKGKIQEKKIVYYVKKFNFDIIYSSPTSRTLYLAKNISNRYNKKVIVENSIAEMNFGIFENMNYTDIQKKYPDEWNNWVKDGVNYRIPNGESLMDVYKRVTSFIDKIKADKGSCILVTHGGIIQTIIPYLLGLNIEDRWHFKISPAAVAVVDFKNDYGVLKELFNC